jgi:hypothetical protein
MLVNINRAMLRKQIGEWQVRLTNRWRRPGYQEWLGKLESSFFNFVGKGDEPESPGASAHPMQSHLQARIFDFFWMVNSAI